MTATDEPCAKAHPQAVFDLFVTAIEGGVNYWAEIVEYKWRNPDGSENLEGFRARILDTEGDPEDGIRHTIDAQLVRLGIARAAESKAIKNKYNRAAVLALAAGDDDVDYDADTADLVVQYGLFGKLVYA